MTVKQSYFFLKRLRYATYFSLAFHLSAFASPPREEDTITIQGTKIPSQFVAALKRGQQELRALHALGFNAKLQHFPIPSQKLSRHFLNSFLTYEMLYWAFKIWQDTHLSLPPEMHHHAPKFKIDSDSSSLIGPSPSIISMTQPDKDLKETTIDTHPLNATSFSQEYAYELVYGAIGRYIKEVILYLASTGATFKDITLDNVSSFDIAAVESLYHARSHNFQQALCDYLSLNLERLPSSAKEGIMTLHFSDALVTGWRSGPKLNTRILTPEEQGTKKHYFSFKLGRLKIAQEKFDNTLKELESLDYLYQKSSAPFADFPSIYQEVLPFPYSDLYTWVRSLVPSTTSFKVAIPRFHLQEITKLFEMVETKENPSLKRHLTKKSLDTSQEAFYKVFLDILWRHYRMDVSQRENFFLPFLSPNDITLNSHPIDQNPDFSLKQPKEKFPFKIGATPVGQSLSSCTYYDFKSFYDTIWKAHNFEWQRLTLIKGILNLSRKYIEFANFIHYKDIIDDSIIKSCKDYALSPLYQASSVLKGPFSNRSFIEITQPFANPWIPLEVLEAEKTSIQDRLDIYFFEFLKNYNSSLLHIFKNMSLNEQEILYGNPLEFHPSIDMAIKKETLSLEDYTRLFSCFDTLTNAFAVISFLDVKDNMPPFLPDYKTSVIVGTIENKDPSSHLLDKQKKASIDQITQELLEKEKKEKEEKLKKIAQKKEAALNHKKKSLASSIKPPKQEIPSPVVQESAKAHSSKDSKANSQPSKAKNDSKQVHQKPTPKPKKQQKAHTKKNPTSKKSSLKPILDPSSYQMVEEPFFNEESSLEEPIVSKTLSQSSTTPDFEQEEEPSDKIEQESTEQELPITSTESLTLTSSPPEESAATSSLPPSDNESFSLNASIEVSTLTSFQTEESTAISPLSSSNNQSFAPLEDQESREEAYREETTTQRYPGYPSHALNPYATPYQDVYAMPYQQPYPYPMTYQYPYPYTPYYYPPAEPMVFMPALGYTHMVQTLETQTYEQLRDQAKIAFLTYQLYDNALYPGLWEAHQVYYEDCKKHLTQITGFRTFFKENFDAFYDWYISNFKPTYRSTSSTVSYQ